MPPSPHDWFATGAAVPRMAWGSPTRAMTGRTELRPAAQRGAATTRWWPGRTPAPRAPCPVPRVDEQPWHATPRLDGQLQQPRRCRHWAARTRRPSTRKGEQGGGLSTRARGTGSKVMRTLDKQKVTGGHPFQQPEKFMSHTPSRSLQAIHSLSVAPVHTLLCATGTLEFCFLPPQIL